VDEDETFLEGRDWWAGELMSGVVLTDREDFFFEESPRFRETPLDLLDPLASSSQPPLWLRDTEVDLVAGDIVLDSLKRGSLYMYQTNLLDRFTFSPL
jgi:hypothetical protein